VSQEFVAHARQKSNSLFAVGASQQHIHGANVGIDGERLDRRVSDDFEKILDAYELIFVGKG
jgi:hypothetical protein